MRDRDREGNDMGERLQQRSRRRYRERDIERT